MTMREFDDDRLGGRWRVWETVPGLTAGLSGEFHEGWLTFDNGAERRRLAPVPADWASLPEERLALLLRVAQAARSRHSALTRLEDERRELDRRQADRRRGERRLRERRGTPEQGGGTPPI